MSDVGQDAGAPVGASGGMGKEGAGGRVGAGDWAQSLGLSTGRQGPGGDTQGRDKEEGSRGRGGVQLSGRAPRDVLNKRGAEGAHGFAGPRSRPRSEIQEGQ